MPIKIVFLLISLLSSHISIQAKEINENDVSIYFEDPIFQDLWFGVYDEDNIRYAWWNINEYRDDNFWIQEQKYESKFLDSVQDGDTLIEGETYIFTEVKEYYDFSYPYLLKKIESKSIVSKKYYKGNALKLKLKNIFQMF